MMCAGCAQEKEVHEQAKYQRLWHRVWFAGIPAATLLIGDMLLHALPGMKGTDRWFWLGTGLVTLVVMTYSGKRQIITCWYKNNSLDG